MICLARQSSGSPKVGSRWIAELEARGAWKLARSRGSRPWLGRSAAGASAGGAGATGAGSFAPVARLRPAGRRVGAFRGAGRRRDRGRGPRDALGQLRRPRDVGEDRGDLEVAAEVRRDDARRAAARTCPAARGRWSGTRAAGRWRARDRTGGTTRRRPRGRSPGGARGRRGRSPGRRPRCGRRVPRPPVTRRARQVATAGREAAGGAGAAAPGGVVGAAVRGAMGACLGGLRSQSAQAGSTSQRISRESAPIHPRRVTSAPRRPTVGRHAPPDRHGPGRARHRRAGAGLAAGAAGAASATGRGSHPSPAGRRGSSTWVPIRSRPAGIAGSISPGRWGRRVRAPCPGRVTFAGRVARQGGVVSARCGPWLVSVLPLRALTVRPGAPVARGQSLGRLAAHPGHAGLHVGVRRAAGSPALRLVRAAGTSRAYVDPAPFFGRAGAPPPLVGRPRRRGRPRGFRPLPRLGPAPAPAGARVALPRAERAPVPRLAPLRPVGSTPAAGRAALPLAPWPAWAGPGAGAGGRSGRRRAARAGAEGSARPGGRKRRLHFATVWWSERARISTRRGSGAPLGPDRTACRTPTRARAAPHDACQPPRPPGRQAGSFTSLADPLQIERPTRAALPRVSPGRRIDPHRSRPSASRASPPHALRLPSSP